MRAARRRRGRPGRPRRAPSRAAWPVTTTTEAAFAKLAFGDRAEGLLAVVRAPVARPRRSDAPGRPADRRHRRRREARQPRGHPAQRGRRRRRCGDRRLAAHGPREPERHPGERRHDLHRPHGRGRRRTRSSAGCASAASASSRRGSMPRRPTRSWTSRAPSRSSWARRRRVSPTPGWARTSRRSTSRCSGSPTASTCRSRPRSSPTRRAGNAAVIRRRQTDPMSTSFDFVVIGAGTGRRGRREQGPRARGDGRDHRQALVRRQLPAHRLHPVQVAAPQRVRARQEPGGLRMAARLRPTRLHGQPRDGRRRA